MATSAEWLIAFSELTGISQVTALNFARALRSGGLYTKPSRGGGHKNTPATAKHLTNYILAQAAPQASDAVDVATSLRRMQFLSSTAKPNSPRLGRGDFGTVIDALIEAVAHGKAKLLPHQIRISLIPFRAEISWLEPDGRLEHRDTYAADFHSEAHPWASSALVKITLINTSLLELAASMLRKDGTESPGRDPAP